MGKTRTTKLTAFANDCQCQSSFKRIFCPNRPVCVQVNHKRPKLVEVQITTSSGTRTSRNDVLQCALYRIIMPVEVVTVFRKCSGVFDRMSHLAIYEDPLEIRETLTSMAILGNEHHKIL